MGLWLFLILIAVLIAGELFTRFYLGLGEPPLSMADPEIEYLFKPNQRCHRFGNLITYNQYSMRGTPNFSAKKTDPKELRILMIGDSILNGGAQTDDSELASTILGQKLRQRLDRPVLAMNVSAGSWGPPNQLAYINRFGLFDADVLVILLNSGDYADVPTFAPTVGVSPSFPERAPILAVQEGFERYLLPRIGWHQNTSSNETGQVIAPPKADVETSLLALQTLVRRGLGSGAQVLVVQYPTAEEAASGPEPGAVAIRAASDACPVPVLDLRPAFSSFPNRKLLYRDAIHPNSAGQSLIESEIRRTLMDQFVKRISASSQPATRAAANLP